MRVNRIYVVLISQEEHAGDENWEPIWNGRGGVRVVALDRDRCMVPVDYGAMDRLVKSFGPPEDWDQVPPKMEAAQDERRGSSRLEAVSD